MLTAVDTVTYLEKKEIVDFLYNSLDQYGDEWDHIMKAVEYAISDFHGQGGFVLTAREDDKIVGAVVINQTGMSGYIPENILVYIAVDQSQRGKGVGKKLMEKSLNFARGDVALHVEPENPAKKLYENLGFTNKYLEMRYTKEKSGDQ